MSEPFPLNNLAVILPEDTISDIEMSKTLLDVPEGVILLAILI